VLFAGWLTEEELGGVDGMDLFVKTDDFRKLNVGFALDEGSIVFSTTKTIHHRSIS